MKKVSLLLALAVVSFSTFAQFNRYQFEKNDAECVKTKAELKRTTTVNQEVKAPGDVIWSEDFTGGLPAGWTIIDDAGIGSWIWIDADTAYTGAYTDPLDAVVPGGSAGGYMHLPADFYNCTPGVWPREMVATPVDMDATLQTASIDVSAATGGLVLKFSTWFRLCCSSTTTLLDVNVSGDGGATWTTLNGRDVGAGTVAINDFPNTSFTNAISQYNISSIVAAGGTNTVMIQFRMQGGSHYFWSIDDIQIVESLENEMSVVDYFASLGAVSTVAEGNTADYNTNYSEVPANIQSEIQFGALLHQAGVNGVNAVLNVTVDSLLGSTPVLFPSNVIANFGTDVTVDSVLVSGELDYFYNSALTAADFTNNGVYEDGFPFMFNYEVVTDNADADLSNNTKTYEYAQTWGRYSYHWQPSMDDLVSYDGDMGPYSYVGTGGAVGDKMCNTFDMYQETGDAFKIYGLRFFVVNATNSDLTFDAAGNGVTITPTMYFYDATAAAGAGDWVEVIDVTGAPYTLQLSDAGTYVYLPFDPTEVDAYAFPQGRYAIGVNVEDYAGQRITFAVDKTYRQGDSHFLMNIEPYQGTWYYWSPGGSVMIDIYTQLDQMDYDMHVGIAEKSSNTENNVKVYPNPTSGLVTVENAEHSTINVYSIAGNLVKTVESNTVSTSVDLTGLAKGTYIVKVIKENEVITKKINLLK